MGRPLGTPGLGRWHRALPATAAVSQTRGVLQTAAWCSRFQMGHCADGGSLGKEVF